MGEKISVIIPIYKVEKYLNRCIESVVNQTYQNLEIILVDDGSPDNCPMMCDEWAKKDERIVVIHKENGGLSDARNAGLDIATGEYVAFVDSDDWLELNYYEKMMRLLVQHDAQIVASSIIWKYIDKEEERDLEGNGQIVYSAEEAINTLISDKGFFAVAWNKIYRRNYFSDIKYPKGKIHEDEFVTYRILDKAEKLVLCKEAKYYYRQREGSIMSQYSTKNLMAMEAFFERLEFLKNNYPMLYMKDKVTICILCVAHYMEAMKLESVEAKEIKKQLISYRKKLRFSLKEIVSYTIKEKIYIFGTRISLKVFCHVLKKLGR